MSYVIRYVALAGGVTAGSDLAAPGDYLKEYDPDAGPEGGPVTGIVDWTSDPAEALQFESGLAAMLCWRQVSKRQPLRADGKPNRPLTAVSVAIEPLDG